MHHSKSLILALIYLMLISLDTFSKSTSYYKLTDHEKPIEILLSSKNQFIITNKNIYQVQGKALVKKFTSSIEITCALEDGNNLWIGLTEGVLLIDKLTFKVKPMTLPVTATALKISGIMKDNTGKIWVGAQFFGAFRYNGQIFEKYLEVTPLNNGVCTSDSTIWWGSDIGLFKLKDKNWIRYNEEGVANFEIPDNIVEKLLVDNIGNLWVIMSEGIAVFESKTSVHDEAHEHIPSAKFLGRPNNMIYDVYYLKKSGFLFASDMGLMLLPTAAEEEKLKDFEHAPTDKVENKQKLFILSLPDNLGFKMPSIMKWKNNNVWMANDKGVLVMTENNFRKFILRKK